MARISEIHYSNRHANNENISEFFEVALSPGEDPADFMVSTYNQDGSVYLDIPLTHPDIQVTVDPDSGETVYVISSDYFKFLLTDPDSGDAHNNEAVALTDISGTTPSVVDFYDIGGGTQGITATNGSAAGATSETLAGDYGASIQFNQPDPDIAIFADANPGDSGIICFVAGTLIDTPNGPVAVEDLCAGDMVMTKTDGPQPLVWTGSRTVIGRGDYAPYRIAPGVLNATAPVFLSPAHRVLCTGAQAELLFGTDQVLVPVHRLADDQNIRRVPRDTVTYCHIMCADHQIVFAHGLESESFYPGAAALDALECDARAELFDLFPELEGEPDLYGSSYCKVLKSNEAACLTLHAEHTAR